MKKLPVSLFGQEHLYIQVQDICCFTDEKKPVIHFKGWSLKKNDLKEAIGKIVLEYHDDSEIFVIDIISIKEKAYSSPRYIEGLDAKDEGYLNWIEVQPEWKFGLGKCTEVRCRVVLTDVKK